jgi:hypothetical protein
MHSSAPLSHILTPYTHLGGLDRGTSSVLVQYLLPPLPAEPLVGFIRFVDKYSINPPTTYVPNDFLKLMDERKRVLEYRQANLTNPGEHFPQSWPLQPVIELLMRAKLYPC